jgi:hypothetical protein
MGCPVCNDKGLSRVCYRNGEPDDFAICLCDAGRVLRTTRNARRTTNPLWHAVAAQRQIPIDAVHPLEDLYDAAELAVLFPYGTAPARADTLNALIAVGKTKRKVHL